MQIPAKSIAQIDIVEFTQVFHVNHAQFAGEFEANSDAYNLLFQALRRLRHQTPDLFITENTKSICYQIELSEFKSKRKAFIDTSFFQEIPKKQKDVECQTDEPSHSLSINWRNSAVGVCLGFLAGGIVCANLYAILIGFMFSVICLAKTYQEELKTSYENGFD